MGDYGRRSPGSTVSGDKPIGEWGSSEARDVAGAARQRGQEAAEYVQDAVRQTRDYVEGAVQQTRDYVGGAMQAAKDKTAEYREGGVERMKDDVLHYTREQPMTALLIAAGVGMIFGMLTALPRRR
jgi:ElaB/YqjD/DUF883 family membrane-anchored ribosome-binding protein